MKDFHEGLSQNAARILSALQGAPSKAVTAWDLKMDLKLTNSALYIALGWLAREGKVALEPYDFTYRVTPLSVLPRPEVAEPSHAPQSSPLPVQP